MVCRPGSCAESGHFAIRIPLRVGAPVCARIGLPADHREVRGEAGIPPTKRAPRAVGPRGSAQTLAEKAQLLVGIFGGLRVRRER